MRRAKAFAARCTNAANDGAHARHRLYPLWPKADHTHHTHDEIDTLLALARRAGAAYARLTMRPASPLQVSHTGADGS